MSTDKAVTEFQASKALKFSFLPENRVSLEVARHADGSSDILLWFRKENDLSRHTFQKHAIISICCHSILGYGHGEERLFCASGVTFLELHECATGAIRHRGRVYTGTAPFVAIEATRVHM